LRLTIFPTSDGDNSLFILYKYVSGEKYGKPGFAEKYECRPEEPFTSKWRVIEVQAYDFAGSNGSPG